MEDNCYFEGMLNILKTHSIQEEISNIFFINELHIIFTT